METKLERIADKSAHEPKPEFTSLYHLINKELLMQCHRELDGSKAVGIDEVTKKEYGENLEQNIEGLVERLKRKSYKPQPSLRVYIPKSNGKLRPLGIASYEDKIVQLALKKVLEAIYEPRFLNCMYGFRPNRGCHGAVKELYKRLNFTKICYIVDADIKGFFDHMKHDWIMKFLNLYIKDPNILWLVNKYLKAGVMDEGKLVENEEGSAQGNIISPILANIYMHNVLTLWYKFIIAKESRGGNFLIVYADDFIAGFQYKWEAEKYYKLLKERMEKFGLELEESKSRMLESGGYLAKSKQKRGESTRLETFDFLGFTFYCGQTRKGTAWMMPKTGSKKFRQKLKDIKVWLYANRDQKLKKLMGMLNLKLTGHYRYYGVSFNGRMISNFKQQVREMLFKVLNRRSNRKSYTREGFIEMLKYYPLVMPKIYVSLF